jgi:hypothetical protein
MNKFPSVKSLENHIRYRVKELFAQKLLYILGATENAKPNFGFVSDEDPRGLISRKE